MGTYMTLTIVEIGQKVRPCWATLWQKVEVFKFWVPRSHLCEPIGEKLRTSKRTHVPLGCAKFHMSRYNESPLLGENADFWPVIKNNTGSFPLRG